MNACKRSYAKELLVYGYVNSIEKQLLLKIPSDIRKIVILFCKDYEKWSTEYSSSFSSVTDKFITPNVGSDYQHFFGDSVIKDGEYFCWKIRIHGEIESIYLSIINDNDQLLTRYKDTSNSWADPIGNNEQEFWIYLVKYKSFWHYYNTDYKKYEYGKVCGKNGDILEMRLDLTANKGILSYRANEEDLGIATDEVEKTKAYRLAVCTYDASLSATIEIID